MEILVTRKSVTPETLEALAKAWYGTMVKGVADIEQDILALGGEWHMDANVKLLEGGSKQGDIWGFNIYPNEIGDKAIEYISLINIRPAQGNRSMEIMDEKIREAVRSTASRLLPFFDL
ncbi:MAG: DUF5674 family protein [bacterium]|nr:DUF5674 family protein [bacterium]